MTNYIVNSPQTLLTGTTNNDLFDLRTAVGVSLFGVGGNDTFEISAGASNAQAAILDGGEGDDNFALSSTITNATQLTVIGGLGGDLISGAVDNAVRALIQGGDGNDTINFLDEFSSDKATIGGNAGQDTLYIEGFLSASKVIGGGDSDTIVIQSASFDSSTIQAGGGNDSIYFSGLAVSTAAVIAGDTELEQSDYDGNDTLDIHGGNLLTDGLIQGNAGNDSIFVSSYGSALTVGGNAGNDTVTLTNVVSAVRGSVNLGGGDDNLSANIVGALNTNLSINGGGGNDTLWINANNASNAQQSAFVFAGGNADFITLSGNGFAVASGTKVGYAAATESNLSATDEILTIDVGSFSGGTLASGVINTGFQVFADYVNLVGGSTADTTQISIDGTTREAVFTATYTLGATARVTALNSLLTTTGSTVFFSDGTGSDYLFVQGGTSSTTSDDLVVKMAEYQQISGITVAQRGPGLVGGVIGVAQ